MDISVYVIACEIHEYANSFVGQAEICHQLLEKEILCFLYRL